MWYRTNKELAKRRLLSLPCVMIPTIARFAAMSRGERLMTDWRTTGQLFHTVGDNRSQLHNLLA